MPPGNLGSRDRSLVRSEPSLSELGVDIRELATEHRHDRLGFTRGAAGAPHERPQESGKRHQNQEPGEDPEPDHR